MGLGALAALGVQTFGSILGADKAAEGAKDAAKIGAAANAAQLAFEQQRYDDWLDVYGPIQNNLAEYYSTIDPDLVATRGLEAYEREYQDAVLDLSETLAQRGIQDSGLALELERLNTMDRAKQRATIRSTAEDIAMQEQLNFLAVGMGQNPANSVSATLAKQAAQASGTARDAARASGVATANAWEQGGKLAGDLIDYFTTDKGSSSSSGVPAGAIQTAEGGFLDLGLE